MAIEGDPPAADELGNLQPPELDPAGTELDESDPRTKVRKFPMTPGVYLMKDAAGRVLYVGKAVNLRSRAGSYFTKAAAEDHRTAVRNIRRDANERLKKMLKDKQISEDNERDGLEEVQKLTNSYISKIDELTKTKEHEITSV